MSTMLAEEVATVSKGIRTYSTNAPIKTAMKTVTLPGKPRERDGEAPPKSSLCR